MAALTATLKRSAPAIRGHSTANDDVVAASQILFARLTDLGQQHPDYARVRERIIELFAPFAKQMAQRFQNRGESLDDLTQVAYVGLVKAVDRYDCKRSSSFLSYALPTIIGEIKRHFRDKSWSMRVPRRLQELRLQLTRATNDLTQELGRTPTVTDLAEYLEISEEEVLEGLDSANAYTTLSWSAPVGAGGEATELGDLLGEFDRNLATVDDRETVRALIAELPRREQHVLHLRFYADLTQSQIGQRIGISQMQVSRLLSQSLHRLHERLYA